MKRTLDRRHSVPQPCGIGGPCGPAGRQGQAGEPGPQRDGSGPVGGEERREGVQGGCAARERIAFKAMYGTNANKANAFGKCVSGTAKKAET